MKAKRVSLVAAAVVIGALSLYYGARARDGADEALPRLLAFAPADSRVVAYADVAALRNSPLLQRLASMSQSAEDNDYKEFVRATGFDYQRDLDRALIANRPNGTDEEMVAVAEGRFDRQKIEAYALRSGTVRHEGTRDIYQIPSSKPGKTIWFTFLANDRIELRDGGDFPASNAAAGASLDPAFPQRISRVSGSPIFALIKAPAGAADGSATGGSPFASSFKAIRWLSLAARPEGDDILLSAEGECDTPEQAQSVATGVELLRGVFRTVMADPKTRGKMPPASAAALDQVISGAKVSTDAARVRLLLTITQGMLQPPSSSAGTAPSAPPSGQR